MVKDSVIAAKSGRYNVKSVIGAGNRLLPRLLKVGKRLVSASINPHFIKTSQGDDIRNPPHTESSDSSVVGDLGIHKTKNRLDVLQKSLLIHCVDLLGEIRGVGGLQS